MKPTHQNCNRIALLPIGAKATSLLSQSLALLWFTFAAGVPRTSAQDARTTVGWWHDGSNLPVVEEQIGGSTLELVVRREGDTANAFTVQWETTSNGSATPDLDFRVSSGTLTFAAGESEEEIEIPILDDGLIEFPETIELRLFNASDGVAIPNPTTQAVILDNEVPPTLGPLAAEAFDHLSPLPSSLTAVTSDGGILELDLESSRLLRFAMDGTLTSFSLPISLQISAIPEHALLATADNKAILSAEFSQVNGPPRLGIVRLLLDGTVDPTFMPPAELETTQFQLLTTLRDAGMLLAEENTGVIRLLENGSREANFVLQANGYVDTAVELEAGTILVRMTTGDWYRVLPNGELDPAFQQFITTCQECNSFALPDGTLIVTEYPVGGPQRFYKISSDGSLDKTFHVPAWVSSVGPGLPDGRFFAEGAYGGGNSSHFFAILKSDGSIDENYPGFVAASDNNSCGIAVTALSNSVGLLGGCTGTLNGRETYAGTRIRLHGPFKNLIYSSSTAVLNPDTRAVLEFVRSGETTGPASVRYRTRDGTAKAGQHYIAASGELTFAPLESRKTIEIELLPRSEFTEAFEVVLDNATGGEVAGSPITVTILGKQPRFGIKPVEVSSNGSPLIRILEQDYNLDLSMGTLDNWWLEASVDLMQWTNVTGEITFYDLASQQRLIFDVTASNQPRRYYRLRK